MTVGKFCNREVVIADKNSTILEVARLMRQHHVGDVVIVHPGGDKPKPIGILTDRDIVVELLAAEVPLDAVSVGDVMTFALVTAREQDSIWDTLQSMRTKGIRRVPVVNDQGGLEGILTVDDLLELLAEELILLAKVPVREQMREEKTRP
ncbi:MAG: CBS domain-containing protein [Desulfobulbaceae bacterium]|nr:CBS domain-containing protein [Desulfobulbaceae bacterium]